MGLRASVVDPPRGLLRGMSYAQGRVRTRAQLLAAGVGADAIGYRVRAGRWARLAPGVYLTSPPATADDLRRAATLHGGPGAALSGAAALQVWGLRGPDPGTELVLVPPCSAVASWGRIVVRRTVRPFTRHARLGLPLASPARCVADTVVGMRPLPAVQAVVSRAIQQQLCSVAELAAELEAGPRRGSRNLREAVLDAGHGAHSPAEALAGRELRAGGVVHLEQNAEVRVGSRRFVADFLDRARRAVIEIDSTEYHLREADHDATLRRDQLLQAAGYAVLHVKPRQVRDEPGAFVRIVTAWLSALDARSA